MAEYHGVRVAERGTPFEGVTVGGGEQRGVNLPSGDGVTALARGP